MMSLQSFLQNSRSCLCMCRSHDHRAATTAPAIDSPSPYRISDRHVQAVLLAGAMALRIQDDEILGVEAYAAELELLINGANQVQPCGTI